MAETGYTLITGGAGFIGSNLADALLEDGDRVVVLDNLSRPGVVRNADWLRRRHGDRVRLEVGDVTDTALVDRLVGRARRVYHLAAQVAVTTSVDDPTTDFRTNLLATFQLLEAARRARRPPGILFTSTNKVYGGLDGVGVDLDGDRYVFMDGAPAVNESVPLDFHSPYGCSKGAADQYVRDYARIYGLRTVVFRLSCIYGRRQWGTEDQGWVAHFGRSILAGEPISIYGDGRQVRDILWIDDLVAAMRVALDRIEDTAGEVFNIGGGAARAVTVRQVADRIMDVTGRTVPVFYQDWRPGDQRVYISDTTRIRERLGWEPATDIDRGLEKLVAWLESAADEERRRVPRSLRLDPQRSIRAAS